MYSDVVGEGPAQKQKVRRSAGEGSRRERKFSLGPVLVWTLLSLALHFGLFLAPLPRMALHKRAAPLKSVEFEVVENPPKEPEVVPVADSQGRPEPAPARDDTPKRISARPAATPAATEKVETPPAAEEPVRFDNLTLSNETNAPAIGAAVGTPSAGTAKGSGQGTGGGAQGGGGKGGSGSGAGRGNALVALEKLSRAPRAPNLDGALERNYPKQARLQGVEGVAVVRARVNPDGSIVVTGVESESVNGFGFGEACKRTLSGSRWSPPVDDKGQAVATLIRYSCDFRVRY